MSCLANFSKRSDHELLLSLTKILPQSPEFFGESHLKNKILKKGMSELIYIDRNIYIVVIPTIWLMNQLLLQNEIEMLMCFFPKLGNLTSKEIENKSGYSHESTFRILKGLVGKKYLIEKKVGKTNVYEFVKDRDSIYQIFINYVFKKRTEFKHKNFLIYRRLNEFIQELKPEDLSVFIIFGSFAKGAETKNSDLDILCVTNKKNTRAIAQTFKTKYNMNLQPAVVKISDFKNIKKDNPQFWSDLMEYGIVLEGLELFFKEAYLND